MHGLIANRTISGILKNSQRETIIGANIVEKGSSNGLEYLKQYAGVNYTGDANYIDQQGTRDGNIVTAGGLIEKRMNDKQRRENGYLIFQPPKSVFLKQALFRFASSESYSIARSKYSIACGIFCSVPRPKP